jgi:hypothetical protein
MDMVEAIARHTLEMMAIVATPLVVAAHVVEG